MNIESAENESAPENHPIELSSLIEVFSIFGIDRRTLPEAMQREFEYLSNGTMTPEEHRSFLIQKYGA